MANLSEVQTPVELLPGAQDVVSLPERRWITPLWQIVRFGIVGVLNTTVDIIALNILLWRFPTHDANLLLFYNSIAYILGALNSFGFNKYWTFKHRQAVTGSEILRFAIVNIIGILCNDGIIWSVASISHTLIANPILWANASKGCAIIGIASVSYLGMRLWVFSRSQNRPSNAKEGRLTTRVPAPTRSGDIHETWLETNGSKMITKHSLSVIMPAHNEEAAIAATVHSVVNTLKAWVPDFEVIVVNDGSKDRTRSIVEEIAASDQHVRLINHPVNQGYGAALVSGFEAITKDLVFFMDSDGQFDIADLERFFAFIDEYDAVLGYRIDRQDTWVRKLNAWGWKMLVRLVFGLRVGDIDCAFKLYPGKFFHEHRLETRGAMINAEILYKFTRAGYTYTQLGVRHLPRRGGRATGAKPAVIARAFREMFTYARKWHREERESGKIVDDSNK
ncbi:MAG TPA: glycosyltransferase [Ktedonobacteraceae bacterium]|nr:glycosyltransferase [Ktedonobacteraceae bacterium]